MPFPWIDIRIQDVLDVVVVSVLLYTTIIWLRRTRAAFVMIGILIFGGVYLFASGIGLQLTAWIFQGFFAVFLIMIVVIFQEELKQVFERIALWSLRRGPVPARTVQSVDRIVSALAAFSNERTGALIVIPGADPIDRHVNGGIVLSGLLSEPLLRSLFDKHSPGHDGAILLRGDRIERFAVHLPLSKDVAQLPSRGTRHSAALGLAERTDALCLVVSEERGEISVARAGRIERVRTPQEAGAAIEEHLAETSPQPRQQRFGLARFRRHWREKLAAVGIAIVLWILSVPGSQNSIITVAVPVTVENLASNLTLDETEPETVGVTLSGPRRAFYLFDPASIRVTVDASLAELGRRTFRLYPHNVSTPRDFSLESIQPQTIRISVTSRAEDNGA